MKVFHHLAHLAFSTVILFLHWTHLAVSMASERLYVRLSYLSTNVIKVIRLIEAWLIMNMPHQGAAGDMASVRLCLSISRMDILV